MNHNIDLWWELVKRKELMQVYFTEALKAFAISLLGLFIPLYLYRKHRDGTTGT